MQTHFQVCVCVGVRAGICGSPETVAERADWGGKGRNRREVHERVGAERVKRDDGKESPARATNDGC